MVATFLGSKGYRILTASDGEEGVNVYSANKDDIALVLCDMGLPKINGWDVYKKMKELNPDVKAIIASGYFEPGIKSELLKAGVKDFVHKPYHQNEILVKIRKVIDI